MARIIECVPNCSEGRNKEVIEYIADAVRSVPGVALMDYSSDENHNRSVFTIVGDPDQMAEAAFRYTTEEKTGNTQDVKNGTFTFRGNYAYNKRYFVEGVLSAMGSNRFSGSNRYFFAYAIGGAWMISKEDFMKDVKAVNSLKLKINFMI